MKGNLWAPMVAGDDQFSCSAFVHAMARVPASLSIVEAIAKRPASDGKIPSGVSDLFA